MSILSPSVRARQVREARPPIQPDLIAEEHGDFEFPPHWDGLVDQVRDHLEGLAAVHEEQVRWGWPADVYATGPEEITVLVNPGQTAEDLGLRVETKAVAVESDNPFLQAVDATFRPSILERDRQTYVVVEVSYE